MSSDIFKQDFKYYKSRCPPPNLSKVIDFSNPNGLLDGINKINIDENCISDELTFKYGLRPLQEWIGFTLDRRKGLIFIRNPFLNIGQRLWITKCLNDYTKKPNKLNLDVHGDVKASEEWWEACNKDININDKVLQKKLRWSTLGYHHDWDSKVYTEGNKNSFPNDLAEMCKIVAKSVGFEDYIPQASIVNYYHMDSTLAPHTDHSEVNLEAPLISISFGQSALFLIGGETKDIKPDALFLHSGDILIMSKESRLCYHAVPRIISAQVNPWDNIDCNENILYEKKADVFSKFCVESFWKPFGNYLTGSRINLNVRQVLFKDQSTLEDGR